MTGRKDKMVSIIMPAYNAISFIEEAIHSVIRQSHTNWELIVIDNNSTDNTLQLARSFDDPRIRVIQESRQGVSHARNKGLEEMKGDFFCFLDADDVLTEHSLALRLEVFTLRHDVHFVDGRVDYIDADGSPMGKIYQPAFEGDPLPALLRLDERCIFGPSWMIRRMQGGEYQFATDMTHAEDLYFYLTIAHQGKYAFVTDTILHYRVHGSSAMSNLEGLENGYKKLLEKVKAHFPESYDPYLKRRIIRIMFLSWLVNGRNPLKAIGSIFRFLPV